MRFLRARSLSLSMVVLVLLIILLLQGTISYSTMFGRLDQFVTALHPRMLAAGWLAFRIGLLLAIIALWIFNRRRLLFKTIIAMNGVLTFGLLTNLTTLGNVLSDISEQAIRTLLIGVVLMIITNILIFSIWYWIIDPPGVEESSREEQAWDFLFPHRSMDIPRYESWLPRYTDYLYLAFTTSFAFSPTDTLPLTRRAKLLMMLQSTISIITLTAIAGGAINILAGRS